MSLFAPPPSPALKALAVEPAPAMAASSLSLGLGTKTVNLAPADLKKEGPSFDLPIALPMPAGVPEDRYFLYRKRA